MIIELVEDRLSIDHNGKRLDFTAIELIRSKKIRKAADELVAEFAEMEAMHDNSTYRLIEKIHSLSDALEWKQ